MISSKLNSVSLIDAPHTFFKDNVASFCRIWTVDGALEPVFHRSPPAAHPPGFSETNRSPPGFPPGLSQDQLRGEPPKPLNRPSHAPRSFKNKGEMRVGTQKYPKIFRRRLAAPQTV